MRFRGGFTSNSSLPTRLHGLMLMLVAMAALPAMASTPVITRLRVGIKSDHVTLTVRGTAALNPILRMNGHRKCLEMRFTPATLASGKRQVRSVNRGLIRKVELVPEHGSVVVRIYVVSKPRTHLSRSADGRTLVYTLSTVEMARSRRARHTTQSALRPSRVATRNRAPRRPPARSTSARPAGSKSHAAPPLSAVAPLHRKSQGAATSSRPAPGHPTARPAPAASGQQKAAPASAAQRPISLTVSNMSLQQALEAMARKAGLKAEIDPAVEGYVNTSFTDIPLKVAVASVLGQQSGDYDYTITSTALKVYRKGMPQTAVAAPKTGSVSQHVVRDYFPFKNHKASDMLKAARLAVPNLTYYVDDRLNVLYAEGDAADMKRLEQLFAAVSKK